MSERHACRLLGLGRSTHRYRARKAERDSALRAAVERTGSEAHAVRLSPADGDAGARRDAGQSQAGVPAVSRGRIGDEDSATTADPLEWRGRPARQRRRPNERWSMDFVSDCVSSGKVIRMLTIVDDCTRECPAIEVDTSLGGLRVRRVLDRMASERGLPEAIVAGQRAGVSRSGTGGLERRTRGAAGVHSARQAGAECLHRKLQRPTAR